MKQLTRAQAIKEVKRINKYINNFANLRKSGESSEDTIKRVLGFNVGHYAGIYTIRDYLIWKFKLKESEYDGKKEKGKSSR